MRMNEIINTPHTITEVWMKWKSENPQLTNPIVVNNGYCAEFALDIYNAIPRVKFWSNFEKGEEHVVVELDNKFYDAECLMGVTNIADMPIWQRIADLQNISVEEVVAHCQLVNLKELCQQYGFKYPPIKGSE